MSDLSQESSTETASTSEICYLCGRELEGDVTRDHVPPKQFYAKSLRRTHNLDSLLTLSAHNDCNQFYKKDEEYFTYAIGILAARSYSGRELIKGIGDRLRQGQKVGLLEKVRQEWDRNPSGLELPGGLMVKRIEGKRIRRVAWKITRGLFYHNEGLVLPEKAQALVEVTPPDQRAPEWSEVLAEVEDKGDYPGVFAYRFRRIPVPDSFYVWGLLFWDQVLMSFMFEDPHLG